MKQSQTVEITSGNANWILAELERLYEEWTRWESEVAVIEDFEYDRNVCTEVFADGEENMRRHEMLQAKTLTFLNNNCKGHGFIGGFDGTHVDRNDLRLKFRVAHRIRELDLLLVSIQYAKRPESYWQGLAEALVREIAGKSHVEAVEIATRYLRMSPTERS
jgi:hypothetical protein